MTKPIGLTEYKLTEALPENIKTALPSIEELENELSMSINPYITNIFIDSCAFDPKYEEEEKASQKLLQNKNLNIIIAHSTCKEIEHPNTPKSVKSLAEERIFTLSLALTPDELRLKHAIWKLLTGNGNPEQMKQDAEHVFEASKYGSYFITTDKRILKKREKIYELGVQCLILRPSEFLQIIENHSRANT